MRLLPLALALTACPAPDDEPDADAEQDDDTEEVDSSCFFEISLSGALEEDLSYGEDEWCSGSGYDDRVVFGWGHDQTLHVTVEISGGVDTSQSSQTDLPATLRVRLNHEDDSYERWLTDLDVCSIDFDSIEVSETWDDSFVFEGSGSCGGAQALHEDDDDDPVEVSDFTFRASAPFSQ